MPESKHTPGPWHVHFGGGEQDDFFVVANRDGRPVVDYSRANYGEPCGHAEMVANARLITAAPDLLAGGKALADVVARFLKHMGAYEVRENSNLREMAKACRMVREAVRKAL